MKFGKSWDWTSEFLIPSAEHYQLSCSSLHTSNAKKFKSSWRPQSSMGQYYCFGDSRLAEKWSNCPQPDSNLRVPKLFISPLLVFVIIFVVAGAIFRRSSELGLLLLLIWRRRVSLLGAAGNVGRGLGQTFHQVLAQHRAQKFAPPGHLRRPGQRVECLPSSARSPLQRPLIARPNKWAFS